MKAKVAKFGGTSLADAGCFRRAARLLTGDPARRVAVVSAPGRRFEGDEKVTDLLLCGQHEQAWARFDQIARALGLPPPDRPRKELLRDPAYAASRGEALCARLLAAHLGWRYLDAAEVIRFGCDGTLLAHETSNRLRAELLREEGGVVLPGFYGALPDGRIRLFPRGGSDVTGALAAEAIQAAVYENWTDVCGVYRADPRVLPDAPRIEQMSYEELRALAAAGAQVLHESALEPIRRARIPLRIACTFQPEAGGTWVTERSGLTGEGLLALTGHVQGEGALLTLIGRFTPTLRERILALLAAAQIVPQAVSQVQDASALRLTLSKDRLCEALRLLGQSSL